MIAPTITVIVTGDDEPVTRAISSLMEMEFRAQVILRGGGHESDAAGRPVV